EPVEQDQQRRVGRVKLLHVLGHVAILLHTAETGGEACLMHINATTHGINDVHSQSLLRRKEGTDSGPTGLPLGMRSSHPGSYRSTGPGAASRTDRFVDGMSSLKVANVLWPSSRVPALYRKIPRSAPISCGGVQTTSA